MCMHVRAQLCAYLLTNARAHTHTHTHAQVFGALAQSSVASHRRIGICAFDEVHEYEQNVFSYHRMCSLTRDCVLLPRMFSY